MIRPDIQAIVDDIYTNVVLNWTKEEQDKFFLGPYKDENLLIYFHTNLGMWIRNHYNLWNYKWEPEMKEYMGGYVTARHTIPINYQ